MKDSLEREIAIFGAARRLAAGERAAYLVEACGADAALRQRVEDLLQASQEAGAFLKEFATESEQGPETGLRQSLALGLSERAGDHIGRYKLLQQIGEGGCGVVYMAEQEEPVRRRVALKVIKVGMDTRQVIARFEAERQALALMDHPNIAKVLDAGATDAGRPYFVMELVRGIPITRYCDENNLSTERRLVLFVQVCQAIQHAHQKGIIHRDIKPSNILVSDHDGVPVPKVIDFGIAKATTNQPLTDKTVFTAFEQFVGTPAYMSPEQARLSGLDIDTRSDIYSLGVLLYELLTGKTPFEAKRLVESGLDETCRIIREQEPPRPSARLHTLDAAEQTTVAKCRQTEPPKLLNLIRGDLDCIVLKCLEKDRTRRYETANALALDVKRHMNHETVLARPISRSERAWRLVRRNPVEAILAGMSALVLVTFVLIGWSLRYNARLREAYAEAQKARIAEGQARDQEAKQRIVAERERANAERAYGEAEKARALVEAALRKARQQVYLRSMASAEREWLGNNFTEADRLLDQCPQDLRHWEWRYLKRLCHLELLTLNGHTRSVQAVVFSPDGKRLASGSGTTRFSSPGEKTPLGEVRVWDPVTGRSILTLTNGVFSVTGLSFSPKGDRLAIADRRGIKVWDFNSSKLSDFPVAQTGEETRVAFSPSGRYLAAGTRWLVELWDSTTYGVVSTFSPSAPVNGLAFSADGRRLAIACGNTSLLRASAGTNSSGEVDLWDPITTNRTHLSRNGTAALAVAFSLDGKLVASSHIGRAVVVWDAVAGIQLTNITELNDEVYSLMFSPDGQHILAGSADATLRMWEVDTGREELTL